MIPPARPLLFRLILVLALAASAVAQVQFVVNVDPEQLAKPYTGRVYVVVGKTGQRPPLAQIGWVNPAPVFAENVEAWTGEEPLRFSADPLHHPIALSELAPGEYMAQAFLRLNRTSPNAGRGAGDLTSEPTELVITAEGPTELTLALDQVVAPSEPSLPPQWQMVEFKSPALSEFHGFDYTLNAGLRLPKDWSAGDDKKWPVIYYVTGFGGDPTEFSRVLRRSQHLAEALEHVILVTPDATNYRGHSVFVDSENTGPWGHALVNELAPYIDEEFHGAGPERRYTTGISSGGWGSLWLQVEYPDDFAGVWSFVPDPVDFRDFQNIDLYTPGANMYRDEAGERRPVSRPLDRAGTVLYFEDFLAQESIMGPGGQIHSFEATFSPRGADGTPRPLFDRATGAVDHEVAKTWERFDIRLKLAREWPTLGPKLAGKLHIWAGELDTFHLEGATILLKEQLTELGSDAVVEIVPGMPHRFAPGKLEEMFAEVSGVEVLMPAGR